MAGIVLIGTDGDDRLEGTDQPDELRGLAGNDLLIGGAGADTLDGGAGDDTLYVDDPADLAVEEVNGGRDRIATSVSYVLAGNVEVETIEALFHGSTSALDLAGNDFANALLGSEGPNRLSGGAGDDLLLGFGGEDMLIGGAGLDRMEGGLGDDIYYVDNANDVIVEGDDEGVDRVAAAVDYSLPQGASIERLETLTLGDGTPVQLIGSDFGNSIVGNVGANLIDGRNGDDRLFGEAGDDVLVGGEGSDQLFGGSGADRLFGGSGNDLYYVDDASDAVFEVIGEGQDRVSTVVSYSLGSGVSVETLEATDVSGLAQIDLAGNEIANKIIGNAAVNYMTGGDGDDLLVALGGDDVLFGGAGSDLMYGGPGSDTYYVDSAGDVTYEEGRGGRDRVATSVDFVLGPFFEIEVVEAITLSETTPINIRGSGNGAILIGNAGANTLDSGGAGVVEGLGGSDSFAFTSRVVPGAVTTIEDFASGEDRVLLDDEQFAGLHHGPLMENAFAVGSATQPDQRIIWTPANGELAYDADGSGPSAAIVFAFLNNGATIGAGDFLVA